VFPTKLSLFSKFKLNLSQTRNLNEILHSICQIKLSLFDICAPQIKITELGEKVRNKTEFSQKAGKKTLLQKRTKYFSTI